MLGYVKTDTPELRVREHQYYRALYCGLCHRMGKCTGNCSRMTLSYDFVFLATVRMALTGEQPAIKKQRCILHPIRPRLTAQQSPALDYCANASALLVYHKLADDLSDEKGAKKLRARLARPFFRGAFKKAKKHYPALNEAIEQALARLAFLESQADEQFGADRYAEVCGDLLAEVVSHGLEGTNARIAATMGRAVGKWIYLVDAADDFLQDRRRHRFNPYFGLFGEHPSPEDWETLRLSLTAHLGDAERAFLLMDGNIPSEQKEIIANILFSSLPKIGKAMTEKNIENTNGKVTTP